MPIREDPQARAIAFLSSPATFGADVADVQRIDTHCSVIFLAGDRAYKLKRAVRFSYLDYSTCELRRQACEAELKINRRPPPDLYLEVRSTHDLGDALAYAGPGQIVAWVVGMRRVDQGARVE